MTMSKTIKRKDKISKVVVIGTSAGGLHALTALLSQLPADFKAAIFVVQHISADATGDVLLDRLKKYTKLSCMHGSNGIIPKSGHVYLAPSDHHLLIDEGKILITKGAHENRSRPAIDPLFRSAAVAYGNKVIGILLTGYLDDGTSGLKTIKSCGGICIVQDPSDAEYPDMPKNALNQVKADYCLPIAKMGDLLSKLMASKTEKQKPVPKAVFIEAEIAKRVISDLSSVNALGEQVPFNCPGCGGVLWKIDKSSPMRFRCHTGHAYTSASLLAEQTSKIEETMWTALRMFEERKNLLTTMSKEQKGTTATLSLERAKVSQTHIDRIRAILQADDTATTSDTPA